MITITITITITSVDPERDAFIPTQRSGGPRWGPVELICLSVCLYIHLSICLSVWLHALLFVKQSLRPVIACITCGRRSRVPDYNIYSSTLCNFCISISLQCGVQRRNELSPHWDLEGPS